MTRRSMLAASASAVFTAGRAIAQPAPLRNLGGAPAGFPFRTRAEGGPAKFDFLGHCHKLGLGVAEMRALPADPAAFRKRLDEYGMRAVANVPLPRDESGVEAFEAGVKTAKEAGMMATHAAMTARRYEEFDNSPAFKANFERCQKMIELAEPVLRRNRLPLFIENHKGWRSAEQAAWMKRLSSEWVGVHLDFGNNVALCEDPMETLDNLLPYIGGAHIKDMSVEPYDDGFLLSEVPLGDGFLDLKAMVAKLRRKDPNIPLDLEMITRDPLKIPIFTPKYWATFDDTYSPLPGRDVAHIIDLVRKHAPKSAAPKTTGLSPEAQLKLEDDCIAQSIAWARANL